MNVFLCILFSLCCAISALGDPSIRISVRRLGDKETMEKRINRVIGNYSEPLYQIREGLIIASHNQENAEKTIIDQSISVLSELTDRKDASRINSLLPLIELLHSTGADNSEKLNLEVIGSSPAKGTLNYLLDGVFTARMMGAADAVGGQEMEAMLRFYAGNPAQTSEGSWQTTNTMLFVFGDRVLDTLATKVPDRIDAFYKAVKDARESAQSGPGPDEEAIPEAERPTAEQLERYEAAFSRLETLVTTGVLPKAAPPTATNAARPPSNTPAPPVAQAGAPKKEPATKPSPAMTTEPTSSYSWLLVASLFVASIALMWLGLRGRK